MLHINNKHVTMKSQIMPFSGSHLPQQHFSNFRVHQYYPLYVRKFRSCESVHLGCISGICLLRPSHMILLWLVCMEHSWDMVARRCNASSFRMTSSPMTGMTNSLWAFPSPSTRAEAGPLLPLIHLQRSSKFSPHSVLIICVSAFLFSTWGQRT